MENDIKTKNKDETLLRNINKNNQKIYLREEIKQSEFENKKIIIKNKKLKNTDKKIRIVNKKNYINILFILNLLIIFLLFPVSSSEGNIRKLETNNEIVLTIMGSGAYQPIMYEKAPPPSQIIIDGVNMEIKSSKNYNLNQTVHTIIIKWDSPIKTCENMFYGINILTIDFSKFDSSLVTTMASMFHDCFKLKSINFNNFNTSLVENGRYVW